MISYLDDKKKMIIISDNSAAFLHYYKPNTLADKYLIQTFLKFSKISSINIELLIIWIYDFFQSVNSNQKNNIFLK